MNEKQRAAANQLTEQGYVFSLAMNDGTFLFTHSHGEFQTGGQQQKGLARVDTFGRITTR